MTKGRRVWLAALMALLPWFVTGAAVSAATFPLPEPGDDLVGEVTTVKVQDGETLIDIARHYGLGYNEIVDANPGLDPWLPPTGAEVVLPTRYILPSTPREGIIINLAEMRLYYYPEPGPNEAAVVMTFPIGIGQEGWSTPLGVTEIVEKERNPSWTVPASIRKAYAEAGNPLPAVVPPGPDNPLGRHALRLGMTSYLIHGTNRTYGVGMRVSHGCIRMFPEDVELLFGRVPLATPVWIIDQPYKLGRMQGRLFLEAHELVEDPGRPPVDNYSTIVSAIEAVTPEPELEPARQAAHRIATRQTGMPEPVASFQAANQETTELGWMVQLGAFSDKDNASRLAEELTRLGASVSVQVRINDGYCHVLVGPYADEDMALQAVDEFEKATGQTGRVLPAGRHGMLSECLL